MVCAPVNNLFLSETSCLCILAADSSGSSGTLDRCGLVTALAILWSFFHLPWSSASAWLQFPSSPLSCHVLQPLLHVSLLSAICLEFCDLSVLLGASTICFHFSHICLKIPYQGEHLSFRWSVNCFHFFLGELCVSWLDEEPCKLFQVFWLSTAQPLRVSWWCSSLSCWIPQPESELFQWPFQSGFHMTHPGYQDLEFHVVAEQSSTHWPQKLLFD